MKIKLTRKFRLCYRHEFWTEGSLVGIVWQFGWIQFHSGQTPTGVI